MSNFIDFLLVISKLQSPIYCRSPQFLASYHAYHISPNKVVLVGSPHCDGGDAFVFYRYFSCSFVSARGLRLSGAGGDVGVGYAVLIFEWLTRVARGSNFF